MSNSYPRDGIFNQHLTTIKDSHIAQSGFEQSEEFNGQFTDVFNKNEHSQVPRLGRSAPFMDAIVVSKDGVTKLLKGLSPSKALGPDSLLQTTESCCKWNKI